MSNAPYIFWHEYFRVFSIYEVTEEGTYAEDEVPTSLQSASLKIEVVHGICMVDPAGNFHFLKFANPIPKDEDDNEMRDFMLNGEKYLEGGSGSKDIDCEVRYNDRLPDSIKDVADAMAEHIEQQTGKSVIYG